MNLATILAAGAASSNPWTDLLFWVALFLATGFVSWLDHRYDDERPTSTSAPDAPPKDTD